MSREAVEAFGYLRHLARRGTANVHPLGRGATARLLHALDLRRGHRVLELGCGTGETLTLLSAACGGSVDAVDLLPEMLAVARRRLRATGTRARLVRADAARGLPLGGARYDRACAESVLGFQDAAAARRLLSEIYRVLAPGGRFGAVEAVWKAGVAPEVAARVHAAQVRDFGLCQASPQAWGAAAWERAMREAGFSVRVEPLDAPFAGGVRRAPLRVWLGTRLVSRWLKGTSLLSRAARRDERAWREKLRRHAADGALIEGILFVLERPA